MPDLFRPQTLRETIQVTADSTGGATVVRSVDPAYQWLFGIVTRDPSNPGSLCEIDCSGTYIGTIAGAQYGRAQGLTGFPGDQFTFTFSGLVPASSTMVLHLRGTIFPRDAEIPFEVVRIQGGGGGGGGSGSVVAEADQVFLHPADGTNWVNVVTPAANEQIQLTGYSPAITNDATVGGGGDILLEFGWGNPPAAPQGTLWSAYAPAAVPPGAFAGTSGPGMIDLGGGLPAGPVGSNLQVRSKTALTGGTWNLIVRYTLVQS